MKKWLVLALLFLAGCQMTVQNAVKQQTINTWAEKPDGSIERFSATYKDVVYVQDEPPVFYVTSPSGIKVYFQQGFRYFELDEKGDRFEVRLDGKRVPAPR